MIALWDALVEALQAGIFLFTHVLGGSLPGGILAMTLTTRLLLLPMTYRLARRARDHARDVAALQPALRRLQQRWKHDPTRLAQATLALYRDRGVRPVDGSSVGGALVQAPFFAAFYQAIRRILSSAGAQRFLWLRDLSRPSTLLAVVAGGLVLLSASLVTSTPEPHQLWRLLLPAVATGVTLLFVSSGTGLYVLASTGVSALQSALLRRDGRRRGHD